MAELLSPGVFIEERQSDAAVLEAVSTSSMGIVGFAPRGPDGARLVTSFDEYQLVYGGLSMKSLLGHQTMAFFQNSGRRAYISRVTPADAVTATGQIQSQTTDQQIEQQDATASLTSFTKTATTSTLKDHSSLSPLVVGSVSFRYRAASSAVTLQRARDENNTAFLTTVTGGQYYRGRIDPMAFATLAGASSPNGDILYRAVGAPGTNISVTHVVAGLNTVRSVVVVGTAITVNAATDGAGVILGTETATSIATTVNGTPAAAALVTATAQGTGAALIAAVGATTLRGIPLYDQELSCVVPGTFSITFQKAGAPTTLTVAATTYPIVTATAGGDTVTIDLRSGRFSLALSTVNLVGDNGVAITCAYTPAGDTVTLTTGTAVDATGQVDLLGANLTAGGGISNGSFVNVHTGAYAILFQAGATQKPHAMGRILATYKINAWTLRPVSAGAYAQGVRYQTRGNDAWYDAPTGVFSKFDFLVSVLNTDTNQFDVTEQYTEVSFADAEDPSYFPDVLNELSDLLRVDDPGSNEGVDQLSSVARTLVLTGADVTVQAVNILNTPPTWFLGVQPRTVSITFTKSSDATTGTITDDGAGNLIGDIDPTYTTTSSSGLGPNQINYDTGEVNFRTSVATALATLIVMTYGQEPETEVYQETLGDSTKDYTYTVGTDTVAVFRAGTDGTFDSTNFSRNEFTSPTLQPSKGGLYAFDEVDEILQLIVPDFAGDTTVAGDQIDYAESRADLPSGGDRFVILVVPAGSSAQEAVDYARFDLARNTKYAALYWPWIRLRDPLRNNLPVTHPPLGHIAGIYARTDAQRNVGKAPAGSVDGVIRGIMALETVPSIGDRNTVYPSKVNPLIQTPLSGRAVWGARTLSALSDWRQINAVRLFMFAEKSVWNGTHWVPFENNGPSLWAKIKTQLDGFFGTLFNDGYFRGKTPAEAFSVVVDETNNTESTIDLGQVITDIQLAPNKPAEFVRFRFATRTVAA